MDIAVNPALIIALGGTGRNILNRLRRRIRQRVGTDRLPLVEYLYIDTDRGNQESIADSGDGIPIGLGEQVASELANLKSPVAMELDLSHWVHEDAVDALLRGGTTGGAQGFRQLGHISFLASQRLGELNTQLKERVGRLLQARTEMVHRMLEGLDPRYLQVRLQQAGDTVFVYVLASAGGGTGSSTFIDLGYFIRRALRDAGFGQGIRTVGVACLASTQYDLAHQYRFNSAGVLTELNHFLMQPAYRAAYPLAFPGKPLAAEVASLKPYDYHYVVQPANSRGPLEPDNPGLGMARLEQQVAELVLSETVMAAPRGTVDSRVLTEVEARRVDFLSRARLVKYNERYPAEMLTFGVSTREFPVAMHHVLAFGKAVRNLADRWAATPQAPPGAKPDDLGHEGANVTLAQWKERLCLLDDENQYAEHRPRRVETDRLLAALLENEDAGLVQHLQATATLAMTAGQSVDPQQWLISRKGAIDQLFQQVADTPPMGQPGSLYARVRNRRQELAGWGETGYGGALSRDLLRLAFDAGAGAGVALALADRLAARLQNELDYVRLCLNEPSTPVVTNVGARTPVRDWLLLGWQSTVRDPAPATNHQTEAWNHANERLLRLTLDAKAQVIGACLEAVQRMRRRLVNLRDYFRKWHDRAPDPDDPSFQLEREEALYVLRDDALVERFARLDGVAETLRGTLQRVGLYQQLLGDIARGLPETETGGEPALLVAGLPLDRRVNQPDFAPLEEIEAAVFAAIGEQRDGPYDQEVIHLLQQRAEAAGNLPLPDLQAEALPLLQFDTNDPTYSRDCKFRGDAEIWRFLADHNSLDYASMASLVRGREPGARFADTPDTKMAEWDTVTPSVITVSRHRIGVVTPLINGYDADTVSHLIASTNKRAVTDVRIEPPLDPNRVWQAGFRLLGALILGNQVILTVKDNQFEYTYPQRDPAGFTRDQPVRLPMDFVTARDWLAQHWEVEAQQLDLQLRNQVYEQRDGLAARIEEVIAQVERHRETRSPDFQADRLDVWATGGQTSGVYLDHVRHEDVLNLLTSFALEYRIRCTIEFKHSYADFRRVGEARVGGTAQVEGWYCRFCGKYYGTGVPTDGQACAACGNLPAGS